MNHRQRWVFSQSHHTMWWAIMIIILLLSFMTSWGWWCNVWRFSPKSQVISSSLLKSYLHGHDYEEIMLSSAHHHQSGPSMMMIMMRDGKRKTLAWLAIISGSVWIQEFPSIEWMAIAVIIFYMLRCGKDTSWTLFWSPWDENHPVSRFSWWVLSLHVWNLSFFREEEYPWCLSWCEGFLSPLLLSLMSFIQLIDGSTDAAWLDDGAIAEQEGDGIQG